MSYPKGFRKCVAIKDLQKIKTEIEEIKDNIYLFGPITVETKLDKILDIVNYYLNKKA